MNVSAARGSAVGGVLVLALLSLVVLVMLVMSFRLMLFWCLLDQLSGFPTPSLCASVSLLRGP